MTKPLSRQILEDVVKSTSFRDFFTGNYRYFFKQSIASYAIGKKRGSSTKWLYQIKGSRQEPVEVSKDYIEKALGKFEKFQDIEKKLLKLFKDKGYEEKSPNNKEPANTATYATGEKEQGSFERFTGVLYHGSEDPYIMSSMYMSDNFGHGSHLNSLNQGDAFSLTPNINVAKSFGSVVLKFKVDMMVYYATLDEDNFDDIELPENCDAVAIPHQTFQEDEIAVIRWNSYEQMDIVAVLLPLKKEGSFYDDFKEYSINSSRVETFGEYDEIYVDYFVDLFGEDFKKLDAYLEKMDVKSGGNFMTDDFDWSDFLIKINSDVKLRITLGNDKITLESEHDAGLEDGDYTVEELMSIIDPGSGEEEE